MAEDKQDYRVIVLGEDNYVTWKWHMEMVLKAKGLYKYATELDFKGEDSDKATSLLASTLSQINMQRVINCKTAYEIWQALEASFENKSSTERSMLLEKFTSYRIKRISDISKALGDIQAKAAKLKSLGAAIDNEFIISIILKALPDGLKQWKSTWKMINADKPDLNKLITSLMAEISEMREPEDSALVVKRFDKAPFGNKNTRPPYRKSGNMNRNRFPMNRNIRTNDVCNRCNKPGHWAKDCYSRPQNPRRMQSNFANQPSGSNEEHEEEIVFMAYTESEDMKQNVWVADSGCSLHMTPNREWIINYGPFKEPRKVTLGDDRQIPAIGAGDIRTKFGILKNVQLVPELSANLFSISAATNNGIRALYDRDGLTLMKQDKVVLSGNKENGLYYLDLKIKGEKGQQMAKAYIATIDIWHKRLCHISIDMIKRMAKINAVKDLDISGSSDMSRTCHECIYGKCTKAEHPGKTTPKVTTPGASLHLDTIGPFKEPSLGGCKYILLCKDEASSYRLVRVVTVKSEIPDLVKAMISQAELESGNKVSRIVTDNGSEFINKNVESYLRSRGINHKVSVAYTPQQNGFIERDVRTVVEAARTLMSKTNLPKGLWAEAVYTVVYTLNRTLSSTNPDSTPYELWFKRKPSVKNLRVFGQKAIVMFRDHEKTKWDNKGVSQYFVGYTDRTNTYRFYDKETGQVYSSCDAVFLNDKQRVHVDSGKESTEINGNLKVSHQNNPNADDSNDIFHSGVEYPSLDWEFEYNLSDLTLETSSESHKGPSSNSPSSNEAEVGGNALEPYEHPLNPDDEESDNSPSSVVAEVGGNILRVHENPPNLNTIQGKQSQVSKHARRDHIKSPSEKILPSDIHPGHILEDKLRPRDRSVSYHAKIASIELESEPQNYNEAIKRSDRDMWVKAMTEEIESLKKNQVWILVNRPSGNVVTNKWVYKIKRNPQGEVERYKARLVARGFSQKYGIDYLETYAPVANMVSIRMLFAYAAMNNLEMAQFDIKTAFLYGELDETVYMEQPEGFEQAGDKVCLLKRSLYGLKQSPRQWNLKFSNFLQEMNLKASDHDSCIFYRKEPLLIIAIYVDDGIVFARNKAEVSKVINQLNERFEMHVVKSSTFLGFQFIKNNDGNISLHQSNYIKMILKKFNMEESKAIDSPITASKDENSEEKNKELDPNIPYREAIGSLMYAAVITRIDIAHAVSKASRHVVKPTIEDWSAVKRIFRYLRSRENYSLTYGKNHRDNHTKDNEMIVYCDSDFAGDTETSRSTTGSVFIYGGGPIQWKSQRQSLVTLSSTEAEFVSICSTVKETIWIRKLGIELGLLAHLPTKIYCDNQSAIRIASNEKSVQRTRHMSVQANYPREQIERGEITIEHVKSENQLADMLTKPTTIKKFISNSSKLMTILFQILYTALCVLLISQPVLGFLFERVNPLIFIPTDNYVETGYTTLNLDFTYKNPCEVIPIDNNGRDGLDKIEENDLKVYQQVRKDCENMYDIHWSTRMQELIMYMSNRQQEKQLQRKKRNPLLLMLGGIVITGVVVTDLISSAFSYILPWGDSSKINVLESQTEIDRQRLSEFERQFNTSETVQKGILNSLTTLQQRVYQNSLKIQHLTDLMPRIMWDAGYIQNMILEAGVKLEYILIEAHKGRAATQHMSLLYNYTDLRSIAPEDTLLLDVYRKSNATVMFKIALRNKSKDTSVYKTYAFNYWENITGTPYQMVYKGKDFLIHNVTSNCIRAIDQPNDKGVQEECTTQNFKDPKLKKWEKASTVEDIQIEPKIKRAVFHNYISCYNYTITIEKKEYDCPIYQFRLPLTVSFYTYGHNHTAVTISKSWAGPQWKMIDTSLPSLLMPEEADEQLDLVKTLDKLREMEEKLSSLKGTNEISDFKSNRYIIFFFMSLSVILATITIVKSIRWAVIKLIQSYTSKKVYDEVKTDASQEQKLREDTDIKEIYNQRYLEQVANTGSNPFQFSDV